MSDEQGELSLHYTYREYKPRHVAFWRQVTGQLISDLGRGIQLNPAAPLSYVLNLIEHVQADLRPRVLFVMGGATAAETPKLAWWREPAGDGWSVELGEIAKRDTTAVNAATYTRAGVTVDVRMSAVWFDVYTDPVLARDAWLELRHMLTSHFDAHATLLATPAQTGADLLLRSLPRARRSAGGRGSGGRIAHQYPLAPAELQEMLWHNAGQGRFEFWNDTASAPGFNPGNPHRGQQIEGLYILDARWMYAACVKMLPVGPVTHSTYPEGADPDAAFVKFTPGWYRVSAQVPEHWHHVGLIGERSAAYDGHVIWPNTPGQWIGCDGGTWVSGAELQLALQHGWPCLIWERWAYEQYELAGADPAGEWQRQLVRMRGEAAENQRCAAMLQHAIRKLLLDTVGAWAMQANVKMHITPLAEASKIRGELPGQTRIDHQAGLVYWRSATPLRREQLVMQRPEWACWTWAKARYFLAQEDLRIPFDWIIANRSDAIITTRYVERTDTGRPGCFRPKPGVDGPLLMPATPDEMMALRRGELELHLQQQGA